MTEIDRLEYPLRKAHAERPDITFQVFVDAARYDTAHPLHSMAVAYNKAVYAMQSKAYRP